MTGIRARLLLVRLVATTALVVLLAFFVGAQVADSPWPMFHGNAQHTGVSPYDTSHNDGTLLWSYQTGDGIESSAAIGPNGTIYIGSHDGFFYAFAPSGVLKWRVDIGPPNYDPRWNVSKSIMATPAVAAEGTVYIYSSADYLFALNPDGSEKWRFFVKWHNDFWSSPAIGPDGTIYIGSARNDGDNDFPSGLYAINPDGTEKWRYGINSGVTTSPAIGSDGTIYIGAADVSTNRGKLFALNRWGNLKWVFTTEQWMESSPAIADDGMIYIGSGREGRVYAIHPNGREKWRFQANDGVSATPAIGQDGKIYIGSWDLNFYALDAETGTEIWRYETGEAFEGVSSSAAIGTDGTIHVGANDGKLYAFTPSGEVKWFFETPGSSIMSSPAIGADGTIYFGSWDRSFYAVGSTGR
jgi:outer membrane protein assembly factor BamB